MSDLCGSSVAAGPGEAGVEAVYRIVLALGGSQAPWGRKTRKLKTAIPCEHPEGIVNGFRAVILGIFAGAQRWLLCSDGERSPQNPGAEPPGAQRETGQKQPWCPGGRGKERGALAQARWVEFLETEAAAGGPEARAKGEHPQHRCRWRVSPKLLGRGNQGTKRGDQNPVPPESQIFRRGDDDAPLGQVLLTAEGSLRCAMKGLKGKRWELIVSLHKIDNEASG